jgi:hypothetical protein
MRSILCVCLKLTAVNSKSVVPGEVLLALACQPSTSLPPPLSCCYPCGNNCFDEYGAHMHMTHQFTMVTTK